MLKKIKIVTICLVLLVLAGCANTAAIRTETGLKLNLSAKDTEGYAVLKVVSLRPISLLNPNWKTISITSNGNQSEMQNILPQYNMLMGKHIPTESLYFAKLGEGEYDITGMGSLGPGGLLVALLAGDRTSTNQKLPHFTVQAGRIANLGTLVFSPEIENESPEQLFLLHGPLGKTSARNALLFESNEPSVSLLEAGGWKSVTTAEEEAEVLAKATPRISMLTINNSSNELTAGSHLGQILRRSGPQDWSRESIGTLGRVYSIVKSPAGKVIVGSDYGEYFIKNENGIWSSFRLKNESGRIIHIEPRSDGSAIFVTGDLLKTRIWFKKSLEDSTDAPTEIANVNSPPDNLLVTDQEVILAGNIPGLIRETVITRVNKQTLVVTSKKENFWVIDWQYKQDGTVSLTRMNGLSLYSSTWVDNQQTWKHTDAPATLGYWYDKQHAVSIKSSAGFRMVSNQLHITSDGGKTWHQSGAPLDTLNYAGRVVFADANEILLQGSNMLYSTKDQGNTWQRIFPPQVAHK